MYQIPLVTHKFAHNSNESRHMTYTIAHIVDGFGHSTNIFGCNMNEYRHLTYRIHLCPWNNITDGTPYVWVLAPDLRLYYWIKLSYSIILLIMLWLIGSLKLTITVWTSTQCYEVLPWTYNNYNIVTTFTFFFIYPLHELSGQWHNTEDVNIQNGLLAQTDNIVLLNSVWRVIFILDNT